MSESIRFDWRYSVRLGLVAGVIALAVSVIGMVEVFSERWLIGGVFTVGHLLLFAAPVGVGYLCARETGQEAGNGSKRIIVLVSGLIAGLLSALPLIGLVFLTWAVNLRDLGFVNITPALIDLLTFNRGEVVGSLILMGATGVLGLVGAAVYVMPDSVRRPLMSGVLCILGVGLFSDVVITVLRRLFGRTAVKFLYFVTGGLKPGVALGLFLIAGVVTAWWRAGGQRFRDKLADVVPMQPQQLRLVGLALGILLTLALPLLLGTYLS